MLGVVVSAPVAHEGRDFADDETFDVGAAGFAIGLVGAVVTDLRIRENDDLAGVRRVSEDFLIAGDGGIENDFAGALGSRAKTNAFKNRAVFQGEYSLLQPMLLKNRVDRGADHFI